MRESFAAFKELVQKFPTSNYAEDARIRMTYLTNALGMYEVHVASYYYARGAYVAAANRAQASLVNHPRTPSNEMALDLMVRSYRNLGLTQLADDARAILEKTFPSSVYLATNAPARPWWRIW
jgi:outer membrane protein assembly factor BamD